MKAIIYPRVSTLEQVEGTSLEVQEQICRQWCEARGVEVVRVFLERGESAKTVYRRQLQAALAYIRERKDIDYFVVYRIDRFARASRDYFNLLADLAEAGCRLVSATEPIDHDTPAGRLMGGLLALQAQFDNEVRAERSRLGMQQVIRRGGWAWRAPCGFRIARMPDNTPTLIHDEQTAPVIRKMFEMFASGHVSQADVARYARTHGLRLAKQSVCYMLRNPIYAARIRTHLNANEIDGNWEPIVPRDIWEAVQARFANSAQRGKKHVLRRPEFPLKGLLFCSQCKRKMTAYFATGRHGRKYPYYGCLGGCSRQMAPLAAVHGAIEDLLANCSMPTEEFEHLRRIVTQHLATAAQRVAEAERRKTEARANLKRQQERLLSLLINETITEADYRDRMERLRAEIAEIDRGIAADAVEFRDLDATLEYARLMLLEPLSYWRKSSTEQQIRFLHAFFPRGLLFCRAGEVRTALKLIAPETSSEISGASSGWLPNLTDVRTALQFLRDVERLRLMAS